MWQECLARSIIYGCESKSKLNIRVHKLIRNKHAPGLKTFQRGNYIINVIPRRIIFKRYNHHHFHSDQIL